MRILFLGYDKNQTSLIDFLSEEGHEVSHYSAAANLNYFKKFDFVISFGYRHIIKKDVIDYFGNKIINLHIALLPFNRGSHPNFWSFWDGTPAGVTIHLVDEGIDTGDILYQKLVPFLEEEDTFAKTYAKLTKEIETLFKNNFNNILNCEIKPRKQIGEGTYHRSSDLPSIESWSVNIKEFVEMNKNKKYMEIIDKIEKVRSSNNVNWMDVLRLAFNHAPEEAKNLVRKINKTDTEISHLLEELSGSNLEDLPKGTYEGGHY